MVYFKRKSNIIFRDYGTFGYITDNRNFGYKQVNNNEDIGDKILSQSGSVFFSVLDNEPQPLNHLVKKICNQFSAVEMKTIKEDAQEFYKLLEAEGFVASGDTLLECKEKDLGFSYKNVKPKREKEGCLLNNIVEKSTQEFMAEYFENKPQLISLHIEITSKCNERCVHCYIPHENKVNSMDSEMFFNILEQCRKMNLLHLTISGGEPMSHEGFIDFLNRCNEYNFSVNVLSNLTLLNEKILDEMKKNPLLCVQTSLYSMDAEIHDAITQVKGSFEKTKNAVLMLLENDIPLQISCPIMKQNMHCYSDVVNWGKEHNINVGSDYVIIAKYNHTIENLKNRLSLDDVRQILSNRISNSLLSESAEKENEEKKITELDDNVCSVCRSSMCISENGNVYPCAGWQDYVLGNINETTLDAIWKNSEKVQYLRNLCWRDFPKCIQCEAKEFCTMCMVRNANESSTGNPLEVNKYFCQIAELNKEMSLNIKG